MESELTSTFADYGFAGLAVLGLAIFLLRYMRASREDMRHLSDLHREERKEWLEVTTRSNEGLERAMDALTAELQKR